MQDRATHKWAEQLRGCRNWTQEQAQEVLERQRASGESVTVFARQMGLVPQRLFWWKSRLRAKKPSKPAQTFVPVVVRQEPVDDDAGISVELGDGVRLRVHRVDAATAGWVALLLSARERP